jgi:hypothetical protein
LGDALGANEEIILMAQGDGSHGPFGGVVVELQKAVIKPRPQLFHARQSIAIAPVRGGFLDIAGS